MTKIKNRIKLTVTLSVIILVYILGLGLGYNHGIKKHDNLLIELQKQHIKIYEKEQAKLNEYKQISNEYYEAYIAASNYIANNEPARVYVQAACPAAPLPSDTDRSVGDEPNYNRTELHPEVTKRITAVTNQATKDMLKCKAQLTSLQKKIKVFNKGK